MKELLKSIFESSQERIKNPLIGTFAISWILINWKPVFILLFSKLTVEKRILEVELSYTSFNYNFLLPLLIALFYVILFPYLMWLIDELIKKSTKERKINIITQLILDVQGKQKLAIEETKLENIKSDLKDKVESNRQLEKLNKEIELKNNEIESQRISFNTLNENYGELKALLKESDKTEDMSNPDFEKLKEEYSEFRKSDMYEFFREIGISIRNKNKFPDKANEIIKEKYLMEEIVEEAFDEINGRNYYKFSVKGNFYWKKYVMGITIKKQVPEKGF
jgi:predicted transcriptional regulator